MKINKLTTLAAVLLLAGSTASQAQDKTLANRVQRDLPTTAKVVVVKKATGEVKTAGLLGALTGRTGQRGYSSYGRSYRGNVGRTYGNSARTRSYSPVRPPYTAPRYGSGYRSNSFRSGIGYGYGSRTGYSRGYYGR